MAMKIMSVALTSAQVAGMTANTSFYIDRRGNLQSCGGPSPNASTIYPNDPLDLSPYQHVKVFFFSGVQTGAVGGSFQIFQLWPNPSITGTTAITPENPALFVQAVAATTTTFVKDIADSSAATITNRYFQVVPILFWTTPPSPATGIFIEIWGQTLNSQYG